MERKSGKSRSSSSGTPNEQRSPRRAEGSATRRPPAPTQRQPSFTQRHPSPTTQRQPPRSTQGPPSVSVQEEPPRQGHISLRGPVRGRTPPTNLHAIPVGGSSSHDAAASIGGFATDASRKRAREVTDRQDQQMVGGMGGGGGGGGAEAEDDLFPFFCTICDKGFFTDKSLFGHMRTHRGRTWKGALPPPVFSRDEFADTAGLLNPVEGEEDEDKEEEEEEEGEVDQQVDQPVHIQEGRNLPPGRVQYKVPDLNKSPPKEGDENDD